MTLYVLKPDLFKSVDFDQGISRSQLKKFIGVGKQMPNNDASKALEEGADKSQKGMSGMTIINLIMNIFIQGALKEIIGTILSLQIVIHMFLYSLPFPGNIQTFVKKLKPIASFNILKAISKYTSMIFVQDVDAQTQARSGIMVPFRDMGIKTHNSIENLGNIFHLITYYLFLVALLVPYKILGFFKDKFVLKYLNLKREVFFGMLFQILWAGWIPVSIALYFQLQLPLNTYWGEVFA